MVRIKSIIQKYSVAFGIISGLSIIALVFALIISIPEESGIFMTITAMICASVSMFLITKDLRKIRRS